MKDYHVDAFAKTFLPGTRPSSVFWIIGPMTA